MQPNYHEIARLFSNDERFTVPLFQRPYVWSKEDQWEPLWDDVKGVLDRLRNRQGDARVASHFLGTIVLEQKPTPTGSLTRREIIDGQQRLTTIQILLKAVEHAIHAAIPDDDVDATEAWSIERDRIARLTKNISAGDEGYKVWPTNEDRLPFKAVMDSKSQGGVKDQNTRMADAYRFFIKEAETYLVSDDALAAARRLVSALRDHLKLIVLDLDQGDEPQAIFETLNAHGTPLLPADLMKNWLLWEIGKEKGKDIEAIYNSYWRQFDKDQTYWRGIVGKGHAARARVDTYLQNWLTKETCQPVSAKHIYDRFLKHAALKSKTTHDGQRVAEALMSAIWSDATRFERIDKPTGNTRFDLFLGRLKSLDMVVFHPLLFAVMEQHEGNQEALDRFGAALESYLVRRMICGMQTRSYGTLGLKLLKTAIENASADPGEFVRNDLAALDGTDEWPSDEAFQREWNRRQFYGYFRRERVLMILRAIEHFHQSKNTKAEPLMTFDWSQVQIEHIMPQSWEQHWPLREGVSIDSRKANIQSIGNLTLVSQSLNPSLSNAAWVGEVGKLGKRDHLNKHTIMHMNRKLIDQYGSDWSDSAIAKRSADLFENARAIWPRYDAAKQHAEGAP